MSTTEVVSPQESVDSRQRSLLSFLWKWWFLLGLTVVVPLAVAAVSVGFAQNNLAGDGAKIELLARDVWSAHTPYTGLIGRMNWNHPGPVMYWLLSPAALIARNSSTPVVVLNVILLSGSLVAALVLAWTLGRRFFSVIVLSTLLALIALPADVIRVVWNPWFPIPFLVLLFVLVARVANGHTRDLAGVAIVGSIMVQTHVGTALIVSALAVSAAIFVVIDARRSRSMPNRWRSTLAWTCGAGFMLWILPVLGVIQDVPGNLVDLGRYFLQAPGGSLGVRRAVTIFADEFRWPLPWVTGVERILSIKGYLGYADLAAQSRSAYMLAPIVTLTAGYLVARRGPMRVWKRYIVMTSVLILAGVFAISRADQAFTYTFAWRAVIAPLAIFVPLVPIASLLGNRRRVLTIVVALGVAISCVVATVRLVPKMNSSVQKKSLAAELTRSVADAIDSQNIAGEKVAFREGTGSLFGSTLADGVINEMDRSGAHVIFPDRNRLARAYGAHRVAPLSSASAVWYLTGTYDEFARMKTEPEARIIWHWSPYSAWAIFELPPPKR